MIERLTDDWDSIDEHWYRESVKSITHDISQLGSAPLASLSADVAAQGFFAVGGFDVKLASEMWDARWKLSKSVASRLQSLVKDAWDLRISIPQFRTKARSVLRKAYQDAFYLGGQAAGNPFFKDKALTSLERSMLGRAFKAESRFLDRLIDDLRVKKQSLEVFKRRMKGYASSVETQFWNGFITGSPDDALFYWSLGIPAKGGNCPDCVELNALSPFRKRDLPTTPRAGDTRCLFNCTCTLQLVKEASRPTPGGARFEPYWTVVSPKVPAIPFGRSAHLQSLSRSGIPESIEREINDLFELMNVFRMKMAVTKGEARKVWMAARRDINELIIQKLKTYNLRATPAFSTKELVVRARSLMARGMRLVDDAVAVGEGDYVYTIRFGKMIIGRVTSVNPDGSFMLDLGEFGELMVDERSRFFLAARPDGRKISDLASVNVMSIVEKLRESVELPRSIVRAISKLYPAIRDAVVASLDPWVGKGYKATIGLVFEEIATEKATYILASQPFFRPPQFFFSHYALMPKGLERAAKTEYYCHRLRRFLVAAKAMRNADDIQIFVKATVEHEMGHFLSAALEKTIVNPPLSGINIDEGKDILHALKRYYEALSKDEIARMISEYASLNYYEFVAEAYAAWRLGLPLPKNLVEILKRMHAFMLGAG